MNQIEKQLHDKLIEELYSYIDSHFECDEVRKESQEEKLKDLIKELNYYDKSVGE